MKKILLTITVMFAVFTADAQIFGDVNKDGSINAGDVVAVYNTITNGSSIHAYQFIIKGVSFTMLPVEGGTSIEGNPIDSYYIGETEVTQVLWEAVMGDNPSEIKGGNLPVTYVTWYDCQTFLAKLNQYMSLIGKKFRLPTEAEWEFAAYGGNMSNDYLYSGSNNIDDVAWYNDNSNSSTHPVKTKLANELGIYDMSGNVSEWCQDLYLGHDGSPQYVIRGGGWNNVAKGCSSVSRGIYYAKTLNPSFGLRLALSE